MVVMRKLYRVILYVCFLALTFLASSAFVSQISFGSTVKICKKIKESEHVSKESREARKKSKTKRRIYCSVRPKLGEPGDYVEIKNQYNYIVAVGRIIKQGKSATIISLTQVNRQEGSMAGYPVMVRKDESQDFWTATTAPF